MRAEIRYFHSPDADPLDEFHPMSPAEAGALIQMMVGPEGEVGEESFQIVVGTQDYLARMPDDRFVMTVNEWDYPAIRRTLEERVAEAAGDSWEDVAAQINRWAQWEFDNYRAAP